MRRKSHKYISILSSFPASLSHLRRSLSDLPRWPFHKLIYKPHLALEDRRPRDHASATSCGRLRQKGAWCKDDVAADRSQLPKMVRWVRLSHRQRSIETIDERKVISRLSLPKSFRTAFIRCLV